MADKTPGAVAETKSEDILVTARKEFERCRDWWDDNQREATDDLRFARLGEQWPEAIRKQRETEQRPCLTFNKQPAFIRQVVNDARQNKPSIKVHPQEGGDREVAEVINGLIRNIEIGSDADVAFDTAVEHAVGQGFGFIKINTKYTCDDAFDQDIVIERVHNPFTVYGDPRSTMADSSDWNVAFIVTTMSRDEYEREYPDAEKVDWDYDFADCPDWLDGEDVVVAEYWTREKTKGQIVALSDGSIVKVADAEKLVEEAGIDEITDQPSLAVVGQPREIETYKVTQRIMSGAEVLKTVDWAGRYIPIVPVYGDEVIDEHGKRHFRSLIRDAKDPQRQFNYWRTTTTELVALAPKAPWLVEIDEQGSMGIPADEQAKFDTANTQAHSYLAYRQGRSAPQRQPFSGVPAGALQEALNANDDMKAIIGIYDASLGARSNETSGRAIMARQREGDVSTFHFIDNLQRAIRHVGRIVLDLIPKVYTAERMIRVLGEDMEPAEVQIAPTGQPVQEEVDETGNVIARIYDITAGKYDLTVKAGPNYTTMREENRVMMSEMAQQGGDAVASVLIPRIAKMMDIPDSDKIGAELEAKLNPQQGGIPPEVQQQMQQGMEMIQQLQGENESLKMDQQGKAEDRQIKLMELEVKREELQVKAMEAQAKLIAAQQPTFVRAPSQQSM